MMSASLRMSHSSEGGGGGYHSYPQQQQHHQAYSSSPSHPPPPASSPPPPPLQCINCGGFSSRQQQQQRNVSFIPSSSSSSSPPHHQSPSAAATRFTCPHCGTGTQPSPPRGVRRRNTTAAYLPPSPPPVASSSPLAGGGSWGEGGGGEGSSFDSQQRNRQMSSALRRLFESPNNTIPSGCGGGTSTSLLSIVDPTYLSPMTLEEKLKGHQMASHFRQEQRIQSLEVQLQLMRSTASSSRFSEQGRVHAAQLSASLLKANSVGTVHRYFAVWLRCLMTAPPNRRRRPRGYRGGANTTTNDEDPSRFGTSVVSSSNTGLERGAVDVDGVKQRQQHNDGGLMVVGGDNVEAMLRSQLRRLQLLNDDQTEVIKALYGEMRDIHHHHRGVGNNVGTTSTSTSTTSTSTSMRLQRVIEARGLQSFPGGDGAVWYRQEYPTPPPAPTPPAAVLVGGTMTAPQQGGIKTSVLCCTTHVLLRPGHPCIPLEAMDGTAPSSSPSTSTAPTTTTTRRSSSSGTRGSSTTATGAATRRATIVWAEGSAEEGDAGCVQLVQHRSSSSGEEEEQEVVATLGPRQRSVWSSSTAEGGGDMLSRLQVRLLVPSVSKSSGRKDDGAAFAVLTCHFERIESVPPPKGDISTATTTTTTIPLPPPHAASAAATTASVYSLRDVSNGCVTPPPPSTVVQPKATASTPRQQRQCQSGGVAGLMSAVVGESTPASTPQQPPLPPPPPSSPPSNGKKRVSWRSQPPPLTDDLLKEEQQLRRGLHQREVAGLVFIVELLAEAMEREHTQQQAEHPPAGGTPITRSAPLADDDIAAAEALGRRQVLQEEDHLFTVRILPDAAASMAIVRMLTLNPVDAAEILEAERSQRRALATYELDELMELIEVASSFDE